MIDLEELFKSIIFGGILALIFLAVVLYLLGFDFTLFLRRS